MSSTRLKTGDKVVVITGKDKGKEGKILFVDRKKNRIIVEGVNMISKHTKPNAVNQQGGIIKNPFQFRAHKKAPGTVINKFIVLYDI